MKRVRIGFSTPKKFHFLSWLIKKVERSAFSHCYIHIDNSIYHADDVGVVYASTETFYKENDIINEFNIGVTDEQYRAIKTFMRKNEGQGYGYLSLLGILTVRLAHQMGHSINNPFADGKKTQICVEVVGYVLRLAGADIKQDELERQGLVWIFGKAFDVWQRQVER